ncbi:MAG TPA: ATP-dependent DNA helicase RecG, partial [Xanthobacteraceae bacterium]|nr:ATP-dependent DNA helicase RecG [Xanthobacteraceae bacterium]
MRPVVLNPLFAALNTLSGVGPKLMAPFGRLLDHEPPRVIDLLFHLPYYAVDRRARPKLKDVVPGTIATVEVAAERHFPGRGRAPYKIVAADDTGTLEIAYFNLPRERVEKMFPLGAKRYVSGRVDLYDGRLQMVHPDRVVDEKGLGQLPLVEPVYSLTEGLSAGIVRRAASGAVAKLPDLPEWCDAAFLAERKFLPFSTALRRMHAPDSPTDVLERSPFRARLAYDELLSHQLALALVR